MSHYQFNRQEILQKAKDDYCKEKATEYCLKKREAIKENSKKWYENLLKKEKGQIKEYQRNRYHQIIQFKNEVLQTKYYKYLKDTKIWQCCC